MCWKAHGLCLQAADLVLCAQSFHWFRQAARCLNSLASSRSDDALPSSWYRCSPAANPLGRTATDRPFVHVGGAITVQEPAVYFPVSRVPADCFHRRNQKAFPVFQRLDLAGLIGRSAAAIWMRFQPRAAPRVNDCRLLRALHEGTAIRRHKRPRDVGVRHRNAHPFDQALKGRIL